MMSSAAQKIRNQTDQAIYRCRKCGQDLCIDNTALVNIEGCDWSSKSNVAYLNIDFCPTWVTEAIEDVFWTKGKLCCFTCSGRLGSFNFINKQRCYCKQHIVPPLHIMKNRINIINSRPRPSPVMSIEDAAASARSVRSSETEHSQISQDCPCLEKEALVTSVEYEYKYPSATHIPIDKATNRYPLCNTKTQLDENSVCRTKENSALYLDDSNDREGPEHFAQTLHVDNDSLNSDTLCDFVLPVSGDLKCGEQDVKPLRKRELRRRKRNEQLDQDDEDNIEMSNAFSALQDFIETDEGESLEITNQYSALQGLSQRGLANIESYLNKKKEKRDRSNERRELENKRALELENDEVPYEWTCCICMELYHQPHACEPCQHLYCDPCLRLLNKNTLRKPIACPLCRANIKLCKLDKDMWNQIQEKFPCSVDERAHRVKSLGLKSTPLPRLPKPHTPAFMPSMARARFLGVGILRFIIAYIFILLLNPHFPTHGKLVKRYTSLCLLFLFHNFMCFISYYCRFIPYTVDPGPFNGYLWWATKMLPFVYSLHLMKNRYMATIERHIPNIHQILKLRILIIPYIFVYSKTTLNFFLTMSFFYSLLF